MLQTQRTALARHTHLLLSASQHLWLDPDEALAAQQLLVPRARAVTELVSMALADALALEHALGDGQGAPGDEVRLAVIEGLWEDDGSGEMAFSAEELSLGMKEAKSKFDTDTFRRWKRARKKTA